MMIVGAKEWEASFCAQSRFLNVTSLRKVYPIKVTEKSLSHLSPDTIHAAGYYFIMLGNQRAIWGKIIMIAVASIIISTKGPTARYMSAMLTLGGAIAFK